MTARCNVVLASWSDAPTEIIEQILSFCDNKTLLALGKVNHFLNHLALDTLLKRNKVTSPNLGYVVSRLAVKEIVPALCAALWIRRLPHITYYLNPDIQRLFSEVWGLTVLIQRLPFVEHLCIYFSSVDRWLTSDVWNSLADSKPRIPSALWVQMFTALLDAASLKGCSNMRVEGAHGLEDCYTRAWTRGLKRGSKSNQNLKDIGGPTAANVESTSPTVLEGKRASNIGKRFSRWVKKRLGITTGRDSTTQALPVACAPPAKVTPIPENAPPTSTKTSPLHGSPSCVTTLSIRSTMLVQPLFLSYTLNFIQHHSPVMRHLELVSIKIPEETWNKLFSRITLPVLETFTYLFDTLVVDGPQVTPRILYDFLIRHPSILSLQVYGISLTAKFPPMDVEILPNLQHLSAHPQIVSWLLRNPDHCANLESVCLTSEYFVTRPMSISSDHDPYEHFDTGILTVAALERPVKFQLKFASERRWLAWFSSHVHAAQTSALQQLTHITHLTLSCHFHANFQITHLELLPQWFALFPCLDTLAIIELSSEEGLRSSMFREAVLKAIPNLKSWILERSVIYPEPPKVVDS